MPCVARMNERPLRERNQSRKGRRKVHPSTSSPLRRQSLRYSYSNEQMIDVELEKAPPSPPPANRRGGRKKGEEGAGLLGEIDPAVPLQHFTVCTVGGELLELN